MRSKSYVINVPPISWARAGRNAGRYFDTQALEKLSFGLHLANQHNEEPLFGCAIHIDITFFMPMHKSLKKREKTLYHSAAPDIDNLCKFLLDSLKGVVIVDDRKISSLSAKKVYDKVPRTELVITEVE